MDKKTIKALILEYKSKYENISFGEISRRLKIEYGINRTRQAVYEMYKRAIKDMQSGNNKRNTVDVANVINIYALGYKMAEIKHLTRSIDNPVTYYTIREIVSSESEYLDSVKNSLAYKAADMIRQGKTVEEIKLGLSYKGIYPTDKGFYATMVSAYTIIVKASAISELVKAYMQINDREVIKEIIDNVGIKVDISEIKSRV